MLINFCGEMVEKELQFQLISLFWKKLIIECKLIQADRKWSKTTLIPTRILNSKHKI